MASARADAEVAARNKQIIEGFPVIRLGSRILRVVVAELELLSPVADGEGEWRYDAAAGQR